MNLEAKCSHHVGLLREGCITQLTLVGSRSSGCVKQPTQQGVRHESTRFEFHPEQVRISSEEILADLRYPARKSRDDGGRKRARRRRELVS